MGPVAEKAGRIWLEKIRTEREKTVETWLSDGADRSFDLHLRPDGSFHVQAKNFAMQRSMRAGMLVLRIAEKDCRKNRAVDASEWEQACMQFPPEIELIRDWVDSSIWSGMFYAFYAELTIPELCITYHYYRCRMGMIPSEDFFNACLRSRVRKNLERLSAAQED